MVLNYSKGNRLKRRSGQFFILSSVVIALILFALTEGLQSDRDTNPGISQETSYTLLSRSLYHEINETVAASTSESIEDNMLIYLFTKQKELQQKGEVLTYSYQIAWPTVVVNTTIESPMYLMRLNYP